MSSDRSSPPWQITQERAWRYHQSVVHIPDIFIKLPGGEATSRGVSNTDHVHTTQFPSEDPPCHVGAREHLRHERPHMPSDNCNSVVPHGWDARRLKGRAPYCSQHHLSYSVVPERFNECETPKPHYTRQEYKVVCGEPLFSATTATTKHMYAWFKV